MPERSDGMVRAEIQLDTEITNRSSTVCIMIDRLNDPSNGDGYNSCGGSDSENDSSNWDRSPRNGHTRDTGTFYGHTDHHGSQKGVRSGKKIQSSVSKQSPRVIAAHRKQAASLPSKGKPRKHFYRCKSCSDDELISNSKKNDFATRYLKNIKENSEETFKDNKEANEKEEKKSENSYSKAKEKNKEFIEKEVGKSEKSCSFAKGKNKEFNEKEKGKSEKSCSYAKEKNTEFYEKEEGKSENSYSNSKEKNTEFYDSEEEKSEKHENEKPYKKVQQKKISEVVVVGDAMMEKDKKERFNKQRALKKKIEKEQTDMLEKQKLKKEDVHNDEEKKITVELGSVSSETAGKKRKHMEKHGENMVEIDETLDDSRQSLKEKLLVNLDEGKTGQKYCGMVQKELDNRVLDSLGNEKDEEMEQTLLKEILDPQVENEMEKHDSRKEASLGFDVDGNCSDVEESERQSTLNFEIVERWQKTGRELVEHTCSFSADYYQSTNFQSSALSSYCCSVVSKDLLDVGNTCPDIYRISLVQDSNCIREQLDNMFSYYNDPKALCELNKSRIMETVNTRSGKEKYCEDSKEKFSKEVVDKFEREDCDTDNAEKDKDNAISICRETDNDADFDYDKDDDDEEEEEGENNPDEDDVEDSKISEFVDIEQEGERVANTQDQSDDHVSENDEEKLIIIDAEEKDQDEKEGLVEVHLDIEEEDEPEDMSDASPVEKGLGMINENKVLPDRIKKQELAASGLSDHGDKGTRKSKYKRACSVRCKKDASKTDKRHDNKPTIRSKRKKSSEASCLKQNKTDILAPKRNWNGRGYRMFSGGEFGRRCSGNGGGTGGNIGGGSSPDQNQRNNEDKNAKNLRNQNNRDRDSDDKSNGNWRQNNLGVNTDTESGNLVQPEPTRGIGDANIPVSDFKRYKKKVDDSDGKKHTNIDIIEWLTKIISLIEENKGPTVTLFERLSNAECWCVLERLDKPEELSEDALQCSICPMVDSLLKHYAHCGSTFNNCDVCVKIFSLICSHVTDCVNNNSVECEIRICKTIRLVSENNIVTHMKTLWFQVRRKLARILDDTEEEVIQPEKPAEESKPTRRSSKVSQSFSGPLPSIPEGTPLSLTSTSRSGSRVLRRKKSNLTNVEEGEQGRFSEEGSSGATVIEAAGAQGVEETEDESAEEVDSKHGLESSPTKIIYSRPEIPDEADAIPTSSEEGSVESTGSGSNDGSGQFGVVTGASRYRSLPMGPPGQGEPYFPSFKDRPTGKKGIGEVVYGNKHQLVIVVTIWEKFKTQYLIEAKLAKHYTEEGVILPEFRSKLRIKGLRYQNEFQWVKVAHLGNGMTGKCHLAMDFETEFKFCVKEIHISNYEKEEIELWSELEHPYIVQVYGAIRHGEKIYILQEFIEGGCLTEAINIQRKLGRRLSQLTALRYFQQLLDVLKYLKSRNILHEDLKADNILLNKTSNTVTIKVADFGLARRCQGSVRGGTKPVGTQTQWSPEKAEARVGYSFAAEVWAGVCVLVHMLSGQPPWVRRYESFKALIVVIVEKSPPMEDIPRNLHESIKDLIKRGFTVCQGQRPSAEQLLEHNAFRLLDEASALQSINGTYSILESLHFESQSNQIDYDPNADLREIYRNLERESAAGASASNGASNGTRRKDRKTGAVNAHNEEVPYYSNDYRVYTVGTGARDGKTDKNSLEQATGYSGNDQQQTESGKNEHSSLASVDIYTRTRIPSHPDNNLDPTGHIDRFFNDIGGPTVPPQVQPNLVMYHPSLESIGSQKGNSSSQDSSLEHLSSGTVTNKLIPDFGKIGMPLDTGEDFPDITVEMFGSEGEDEVKEDDVFENFDFKSGLKHVEEKYTLPTVLNTSADLSPGAQFTSARSNSSIVSAEKSKDVEEGTDQTKVNTQEVKQEMITHTMPKYTGFGDDLLQNINEDELFMSGSPADQNQNSLTQEGIGNTSAVSKLTEPSEVLYTQVSSQSVLANNHQYQASTPYRPSSGGSGLPQQSKPMSVPNKPLVHPHSAPTNSVHNIIGPLQYIHPNAPPLSAQEYRHPTVDRMFPGQTEQVRSYLTNDNPHLLQHDHHSDQKWFISNQSVLQPAGSQSRINQFEAQSMHQQIGAHPGQQQIGIQSMQQYLPTQSRQQFGAQSMQQSGAQSTQQQMEITRQQQQLLMQQSLTSQFVTGSNSMSVNNRNQDQVHMFQYHQGQGHENTSHNNSRNVHYSRSEIQPNENIRPEGFSPSDSRSPYEHLSMPNRAGRLQDTPTHPLSLAPPIYHYRTSTPVSEGHHNGARPKVPKQLFPGPESQQYFYGRRNTDPRIEDPRQVYEQSIGRGVNRMGQYTNYPAQPKTPILNPAINPRPPIPQEGQRMDLRLDINRAQLGPEMPVLSHAQTAPVFSPPKTPSKKSPDFHRAISQVHPIVRKSPSLTGIISSSPSQKDDKMSSSTSKSQFEEQDEAFRELGRTAEEALSQHSDHTHGIFLNEDDDDDFDEEIRAEIDDRYLENPAESLAHVLDLEQDTSITITFRSNANGKEFRMNFFPKHFSLPWEKIIKEQLDGFSRVAMETEFRLQRFCLRRQDGSIIDLDSFLGSRSCTLIMTEARDSDPWWIEGGMISFT